MKYKRHSKQIPATVQSAGCPPKDTYCFGSLKQSVYDELKCHSRRTHDRDLDARSATCHVAETFGPESNAHRDARRRLEEHPALF